jgi:hypothetical protein
MGERRAGQVVKEYSNVVISFAREPHDHIRSNGRIRQRAANSIDKGRVGLERVRPAHGRKNPIAGVLERQMEMRGKPTRPADELDNLRGAVHWFKRANPESHVTGMSFKRPQQPSQVLMCRKVSSVRPQMHTGERNLLETGTDDAIDLLRDRVEWPTASRTAGAWNDAIRTGLVAARLNAQRVRRSTR